MAQAPRPLSALMTSAQSGGTPYMTDRAGPGAFGLGVTRALDGLGDQLMRSADAMADQIIRQQNLENESAARDAATAYRTQTIEKWTGYGSLEGRAAVDAYGAFQKDLKDTHDAIISALPNEQAKIMARRQMDGWYGSMLQSGALHRQKEQKVWSIESSKGAAAEAVATGNLNRQNFDLAHQSVERGVAETVNAGEIRGQPPELQAAEVLRYRGQAWKTIISNLAGEGNAQALQADAYFRRVRDTLDPISQQEIADALRPKVLQARADGVVQSVLRGGGPVGDYEAKLVRHESAGKADAVNADTNATGRYQFIETTWIDQIQKHAPEMVQGRTRQEVLDLRKNPEVSKRVFEGFARENEEQLAAAGIQPTDRNRYLAHWFGAGGASRILSADRDAPISDFLPSGRSPTGRSWAAANGIEGKTVGEVLQIAEQRMGGGAPQVPNRDMVAAVYQATAGDPELQRAAVSLMQGHVNVFNTANVQRKKELSDHVKNTQAALLQGESVEIPETRIRAVDPDNADAIIGELKSAQTMGQAFKALELSSPGQIKAAREDIESGFGMIPALIREGAQIDLSTEEGRAADIATRGRALEAFDKVVARRNAALRTDPTAYLLTKDANVKAAWDVLQANKNEDGWGQYAAANLAAQERLGLSAGEVSLLPKTYRKNIIESAQMQDPKLAGQFLQGLEQQTGKYWPQVFGELTKGDDGLPRTYIALGLMTDPVARTTYANLLQAEKAKPGSIKSVLAARDKDAPKAVATQVSEEMSDFLSTFSRRQQGMVTASALNESATLLAMGFMAEGASQSDAVTRASQAILGQFDVEVSEGSHIARAPKGLGSDMVAATDYVRSSLTADQLFQIQDRSGLYAPESIKRALERNARAGTWVTSPDYKSWTLLGANGDVVLRADGKPVTVMFDDAKNLSIRGGMTSGGMGVAP